MEETKEMPLAVRMRPNKPDDLIGQTHLLAEDSPLQRLLSGENMPRSTFLWGPPGIGKTSIARMAGEASKEKRNTDFVELSAARAGVKEVREVLDNAKKNNKETVLFIDELHRFSKTQQDSLLGAVENGEIILIGATTENPTFSIIAPLISRSIVLTLKPLENKNILELLEKTLQSPQGLPQSVLDQEAAEQIANISGGDARKALTILETANESSKNGETSHITLETLKDAVPQALVRYDKDGGDHYDTISAFIKSVRGSDVDASLYWLAKMIVAGEDPRFIARRLTILAAEDIGLADPTALTIAVAATEAVSFLGMPEGRIPLSEATIYLCLAPKSNSAYLAIDKAIADVKNGLGGSIPIALRDAHSKTMRDLGAGKNYKYPHDYPEGIAQQDYAPKQVENKTYYTPGDRGREAGWKERLVQIKRIIKKGK